MVYKGRKNMSYACLKSESQNPRYGFRFRVMFYISYKPSYMKKSFISKTKKVRFFHRFFRCSGLLTFKQYIEENRWQSPTHKELSSVKRAISDTQDKIHIIRIKRLLFRKKEELSAVEREPPSKYPFLPK
jgi:hypothetical protein